MSRRLGQPSVTFGPEPVFLDFPRSDGDDTKWPTNTTRIVDGDGQVNFMEPVDIDASAQARKWRASVGKAIATKLEMQGDANSYVLRNWPQGYQLFDHNKGPAANPRHDLYLFGCARSGRFRSINEFIPHAIWLFTDPTMNYANCECKYCTKQPQRGITASMGDILGTPSASPTPRLRRGLAKEKTRVSRPYAAIQQVLQSTKSLKPSAHVLDSPALAERNSDLRAVFSRNSMKLKRWYRDGEVVWCELRPPIAGPTGEESSILFWPGLVQEYKLKAVAIPRDAEVKSSSSDKPPTEPTPGTSSSHAKGNAQEEGRGPVVEKEDIPPFRVEQSTVYHVELFAVNKSTHVSDSQVIPYQAYVSSDALIAALQAIPPQLLNFDRDDVSHFNPCPGDTPPSFVEAGAPYAIAVQIASNLSEFFSVTDEWQISYSLPPPPPPPSASQNQNDNSLHAVITAAGRVNSATTELTTISSNSRHPFRDLSSPHPGMPQSDLDKLADEVFGPPADLVRTQTRFQGLWWGPERIWADDFVRLKIPRRCLAPHGAQNISPPGCPSKKAMEAYRVTGRDPSEIGAGSRGVFMRIDALFVVETVSKDGRKRKECRASGPLFELVDEDWDEDEDENVKQHRLEVQARTETSRTAKPSSARASSAPAARLPIAQPITTLTSAPDSTPSGPAQTQPSTQAPVNSSVLIPPNHSTTPTPAPSYYLPPQPPIGYRFRPVLTPGHEVVISLSLLAGRYYPGLLMHPLLARELHRAAKVPLDDGGILRYGHIWALDGLNGGFHCSVDPEKFVPSRIKMLDKADREAYGQLERHKSYEIQKALGEVHSEEDEDKDVDMLQDKENLSEGEKFGGFSMIQDVGGFPMTREDEDVTMH